MINAIHFKVIEQNKRERTKESQRNDVIYIEMIKSLKTSQKLSHVSQ